MLSDAIYLLMYAIPLITRSKAARISFVCVALHIIVELSSQKLFGFLGLHLSFDYLIKLIVLIPWAYLLFKSGSKSSIIIFSASVFEVIMAVNMLLSRETGTSLHHAYPLVVLMLHALAVLSLIGGANGSAIINTANIRRNSRTDKASGGDV